MPVSSRLLIVEDEPLERRALRLLIERAKIPLLIDEAATAPEFERKALENPPDVILLDLRIPGGNGLSSLGRLRERGFGGEVIVLTAYDVFEYAREAMGLDVSSFLVKPASAAALETALRKALSRRKEAGEAEERLAALRRFLHRHRGALAMTLFLRLAEGNTGGGENGGEGEGEEFREAVRELGLPPAEPGRLYAVVAASGDGASSPFMPFLLWEGMEEAFGGEVLVVPWGSAATLLFVADRNGLSAEEVSARILEVLAAQRLQGAVVCAPRATTAEELARSVLAAEEGIEESLLSGGGRVIWKDGAGPAESPPGVGLDRERGAGTEFASAKAELLEGLTEGRNERIASGRERTATLLSRTALWDVELGKLLLLGLLGDAACRLLDLGCDRTALRAWARRQLLALLAPNNPAGLHSVLVQAVEGAWSLRSASTDPHAVVLQGALDYIRAHYDDVTLERVAEAVHVSPSHLSRLFPKLLGKRFVDAVKEIRMERAKELLASGAAVRDAALAVGYGNLAYFSTAFKETAGESPSEYRRRKG